MRSVASDAICRPAKRLRRSCAITGRPPYLLEKQNPEREVISLSWLVSNRLLHLFALADTRGRHAAEMTRPEENLHLWKLVARVIFRLIEKLEPPTMTECHALNFV